MNNPLQGTVKIGGKPVKKVYILAGVTITAAILAFAYYKRAGAPADTTPAATDPVTPADGYTPTGPGYYGGGGGSDTPATPWPYGYDVNGNPIPAPIPGTGTGGVTGSNQEWTAAAIDALEAGGVIRETASAAITAVLGGLGVTSDQEAFFLRAVGVLGDPPQGYPKPIRHISTPADPQPAPAPAPEPAPAPAPAPEPAPAPAPAPSPKPSTAGQKTPNKPSGIKVTKTATSIKLDWNWVTGADGYTLYKNGNRITTSYYSVYTFGGLKANTSYTLGVATLDGGKLSPQTTVHVTTAKAPALTSLNVSKTVKK